MVGRAKDSDFYAADDEISGELLAWSGLDDLWDEYSLGDDHDFFNDVVRDVGSVHWDEDEWDADRPMASEINYSVWILDAETAKAEMRKGIQSLIRTRKKRRGEKTTAKTTEEVVKAIEAEVLDALDHYQSGEASRPVERPGRGRTRRLVRRRPGTY